MVPGPGNSDNNVNGEHILEKRWELRSKIWLECEGRPVIGDGRVKMLRSIHRNGSIKLAAEETGIAYRRIRGAIHDMERTIGYQLVSIQRGGDGGGGAQLTEAGHRLLDAFDKLCAGFQQAADVRFEEIRFLFSPSNGKICHSDQLEEERE